MLQNHFEKLVNSITSSAQEVFSTMLGLQIERGKTYLDHTAPPPIDGMVSLIGLAGNWIGVGSLRCSGEFACKISSIMLMAEYPSVNEEVLDAMAELTNMIIGNVKTQIEEEFGPLGLSIPTVVFGRNFTTRTVGTTEWIIVELQCAGDQMDVHLQLAPRRHSEPANHHTTLQNAN